MNAPRAYVFDLYGTLVDYTSLHDRVAGIVADPPAFVLAWRQKQLAYAFTATLMERYVDFDVVTAAALRYTAAAYDARFTAGQVADLVAAWSALPPFDDVRATLAELRGRGIVTAVLTNATPAALARTLHESGLAPLVDAAVSVDAVRAFKPKPSVYALAVERLRRPAADIGFVSSNGWDATGAAAFGLGVTWCNRSGAPPETMGAPPARTIRRLTELLD